MCSLSKISGVFLPDYELCVLFCMLYLTKSSDLPHFSTAFGKHSSKCIPIFCKTRPDAGLRLRKESVNTC